MTSPSALDLSAYQGEPDFAQLARDGIRVVIIKLTEGVSGIDSRRLANVAAARAAGLRVLPYHFLRAEDPELQAQNFARQAGAHGAQLTEERVCADFEDAGSSVPTSADLVRFLRALRVWGFSRRPIVYTNEDKATRANLAAVTEIAALSDLWLARWASTPGAVPAPWSQKQLVLWQTGGGLVAGVRGKVDEDVVMGDLDGDLPRSVVSGASGSGGVDGPVVPVVPGQVEGIPRDGHGDHGSDANLGSQRGGSAEGGVDGSDVVVGGHVADSAPAAPAAQEPDPDIDVSDEAITWDGTDTLETGAPVVPVGGETT